MDSRLSNRLRSWEQHIDVLAVVEADCLKLEANEKSLYSKLFLDAEGKNVATKEALAYSNQDWINFKAGLAEATVKKLRERRVLEIKAKAYESEYLTYKIEAEAIRKQQ